MSEYVNEPRERLPLELKKEIFNFMRNRDGKASVETIACVFGIPGHRVRKIFRNEKRWKRVKQCGSVRSPVWELTEGNDG